MVYNNIVNESPAYQILYPVVQFLMPGVFIGNIRKGLQYRKAVGKSTLHFLGDFEAMETRSL